MSHGKQCRQGQGCPCGRPAVLVETSGGDVISGPSVHEGAYSRRSHTRTWGGGQGWDDGIILGHQQHGGCLASRVCPLTFRPCCKAATCLTSSWQEARTEQRVAGCVQMGHGLMCTDANCCFQPHVAFMLFSYLKHDLPKQ